MSQTLFTRTTTTEIAMDEAGAFVLTSVLRDNVHNITLRVTVDDDLYIRHAEGTIEASPFPAQCDQVSFVAEKLIGMQIGRGFSKEATERLGGPMGCHRYVDLVREIARSAGQIPFVRLFHGVDAEERANRSLPEKRTLAIAHVPNLENSCWSYNRANDGLFEVD